MTTKLCIANSKGGVGKTTLALNLAVGLAERGHQVLLVDTDPEGGIGLSLGKGDAELVGLADVLAGAAEPAQAVLTTRLPSLRLLPRGRLDPNDILAFEEAIEQPGVLSRVLGVASRGCDIVLLDTPPSLGRVLRAALAYAEYVLVPLQTDPLAMRTLPRFFRVMDQVRRNENPGLRLLGISPTMVDLRREASREVLETLWNDFGHVLETHLPRSEAFIKASQRGVPISFLGGKTPPEARRVQLLAAEVDDLLAQHNGEQTDEWHERSLL